MELPLLLNWSNPFSTLTSPQWRDLLLTPSRARMYWTLRG